MSFADFRFPDVLTKLELTPAEDNLFPDVQPLALSAEFTDRMRSGVDLALSINTEKARSEFIIAPVLFELRRMLPGRFALFSGVELDVDPGRGLNGSCDYILARSPLQSVLSAPLVAIVEAKNDNLRSGLGQCLASLVAARDFNTKSSAGVPVVYGVVTTGGAWMFLRLAGSVATLDRREWFVAELPQVLAILARIVAGE